MQSKVHIGLGFKSTNQATFAVAKAHEKTRSIVCGAILEAHAEKMKKDNKEQPLGHELRLPVPPFRPFAEKSVPVVLRKKWNKLLCADHRFNTGRVSRIRGEREARKYPAEVVVL